MQKGGKSQPGTLFVWELPGGRLAYKKEFEGLAPEMCLFTPDEKNLLVGGHNGATTNDLVLLEPSTGREQGILQDIGPGKVHLAVSPDSRTLAVTGSPVRSQVVRLWDLPSQKEITPAGLSSRPDHLHVGSQETLASLDKQGMRIWNTATGKMSRLIPLPDSAMHAVISSKGNLVASSSPYGDIHVWNCASAQEILRLNDTNNSKQRIPRREDVLGFTADESGLYSFRHDLTLRLWDMKTGKMKAEHVLKPQGVKNLPDGKVQGPGVTPGVVMSPDGKTVVVHLGAGNTISNLLGKANRANTYFVFDTGSGKETIQFSLGKGSPTRLAISPNGRWLLSRENGDNAVTLTDLTSGKTWQRLLVPGTAYPVAFSPDGRMFAAPVDGPEKKSGPATKSLTGPAAKGGPRQIHIYEIASGQLRGKFDTVPSDVWPLAFFPDGRRLASGMGDSTILIWDLVQIK